MSVCISPVTPQVGTSWANGPVRFLEIVGVLQLPTDGSTEVKPKVYKTSKKISQIVDVFC